MYTRQDKYFQEICLLEQPFIKDPDKIKFDENMKVGIITPDIDIIPDANTLNPAYLFFENYEIILKWNRSLRFGITVCTLAEMIKA